MSSVCTALALSMSASNYWSWMCIKGMSTSTTMSMSMSMEARIDHLQETLQCHLTKVFACSYRSPFSSQALPFPHCTCTVPLLCCSG